MYLLHLYARPFRAYSLKERRFPLFIRVIPLLLSLLVQRSARHFALREIAPPTAGLDAGVLQWCAAQRHVVAAAQHQLQHLSVIQTLHRLAVYVRYQISRSQAGFERRTGLLNFL